MDTFADSILSGLVCSECTTVIDGNTIGHPRTCPGCKAAQQRARVQHQIARHKAHKRKRRRPHKKVVHQSRG